MGKYKLRKTKTVGITATEVLVVLSIVLIIGVMLLAFASSLVLPFMGNETVTITITDKERVGGKNSKYLLFTKGEVFKNTDAWIIGKWDSSDIYGEIVIGKTYEAEVHGYRIKFLSMYRNIESIKEAETTDEE